MDPDETLETIRRKGALVLRLTEDAVGDAERLAAVARELAEAVEALDGWLRRGSSLPAEWERR